MRGILTPQIKSLSKTLLGYEINQQELRLMPYVQYCLINEEPIYNINQEEIQILSNWENLQFIENVYSMPKVSKAFFMAMSELIFLGYVVSTNQELT